MSHQCSVIPISAASSVWGQTPANRVSAQYSVRSSPQEMSGSWRMGVVHHVKLRRTTALTNWNSWHCIGRWRNSSITGLEWAMMWSSGLPSVSDVPVPRLHHYLSVLHWRTSSPVNQWRWLVRISSPLKMDVVEPPMCWSWLTISRSLPWLCQQPTRWLGPLHVCSLIPSSFTMDSLPEYIVIKAGISKVGSSKSSVP